MVCQEGHHDFASSIDDARQRVHCCSLVSLLVPDPVVGCEKATFVDHPSQESSSAPAFRRNWLLGVWTWLAVCSVRDAVMDLLHSLTDLPCGDGCSLVSGFGDGMKVSQILDQTSNWLQLHNREHPSRLVGPFCCVEVFSVRISVSL